MNYYERLDKIMSIFKYSTDRASNSTNGASDSTKYTPNELYSPTNYYNDSTANRTSDIPYHLSDCPDSLSNMPIRLSSFPDLNSNLSNRKANLPICLSDLYVFYETLTTTLIIALLLSILH